MQKLILRSFVTLFALLACVRSAHAQTDLELSATLVPPLFGQQTARLDLRIENVGTVPVGAIASIFYISPPVGGICYGWASAPGSPCDPNTPFCTDPATPWGCVETPLIQPGQSVTCPYVVEKTRADCPNQTVRAVAYAGTGDVDAVDVVLGWTSPEAIPALSLAGIALAMLLLVWAAGRSRDV